MAYTEDYHVNCLSPVDNYTKPDMHCPSIGTKGNNFWKANCDKRKLAKHPCSLRCGTSSTPRIQVKSGTTEPYKPKQTQTNTLRARIVKLAKKGLAAKEISIELDMEVRRVRDHLNKARRYGEL